MMKPLYAPADVARWKDGSAIKSKGLKRKSQRRKVGDRLPLQLASHYQKKAMIALADGDFSLALAYIKQAVDCQDLCRREFLAEASLRETHESIRDMGCGPIILAMIVSDSVANDVATSFIRVSEQLDYEPDVVEFGMFLRDILRGETGDGRYINADVHVAAMALAIYRRDADQLRSAIEAGADSWHAYILTDKGWPNSVCYLAGLAFMRLA